MMVKSSVNIKCQPFTQVNSSNYCHRLDYINYSFYSITSLLWILFSISFLAVVLFAFNLRLLYNVPESIDEIQKSYIHKKASDWMSWPDLHLNETSINSSTADYSQITGHRSFESNCRMSNCFNWSRCDPESILKVHIYPASPDDEIEAHGTKHLGAFKISLSYQKVLNVIESSVHYEPDASKACIFVPRFDTLDRDPLSPDFVKHLSFHFDPPNEGRNHLIFNLYSGTWPNYHEQDFAGLQTRKSILAKASFSNTYFRPGFDISLPLFGKNHPERDSDIDDDEDTDLGDTSHEINYSSRIRNIDAINDSKVNKNNNNNNHKNDDNNSPRAFLVFKGKRYIHGIGSETRNALYHLHNGKDVLIYTTCKHGKKWRKWQQEVQDERCDLDNKVYDQIDYITLMKNSTFCLVPRGRRLGSFRFLESLEVGCIPVILSDDWVKPFHELIDWRNVVVDGSEKELLLLPEKLHNIHGEKIINMREKSKLVHQKYFRSVERIVFSTFSIISDRIRNHHNLPSKVKHNISSLNQKVKKSYKVNSLS